MRYCAAGRASNHTDKTAIGCLSNPYDTDFSQSVDKIIIANAEVK